MSIAGLLILIGAFLLGAGINHYAVPGIPAAVIGILLLTFLLIALGEVPDYLSRTATALLPYLPLMLVVPAAGIASADHLPANEWLALLTAIGLSLLVTVPFCGWLLQRLIRKRTSR
ncbi:CidA/LrgA family protein [Pseudomonas sp. Marseille-QA0892]